MYKLSAGREGKDTAVWVFQPSSTGDRLHQVGLAHKEEAARAEGGSREPSRPLVLLGPAGIEACHQKSDPPAWPLPGLQPPGRSSLWYLLSVSQLGAGLQFLPRAGQGNLVPVSPSAPHGSREVPWLGEASPRLCLHRDLVSLLCACGCQVPSLHRDAGHRESRALRTPR